MVNLFGSTLTVLTWKNGKTMSNAQKTATAMNPVLCSEEMDEAEASHTKNKQDKTPKIDQPYCLKKFLLNVLGSVKVAAPGFGESDRL